MHKQWRTVGVALTLINFNLSKKYLWIDSLSQSWTNPMHLLWAYGWQALSQSCLPLVCLWDCKFVSAPKFMNGYLQTCSCDVFPRSRSLSDAKTSVSDLFFESVNSIPRSLTDDHLVWIWCSLSSLLPATLKTVANSLSMFYRCLRFRLLIGVDILFDYCCYQNGKMKHHLKTPSTFIIVIHSFFPLKFAPI